MSSTFLRRHLPGSVRLRRLWPKRPGDLAKHLIPQPFNLVLQVLIHEFAVHNLLVLRSRFLLLFIRSKTPACPILPLHALLLPNTRSNTVRYYPGTRIAPPQLASHLTTSN